MERRSLIIIEKEKNIRNWKDIVNKAKESYDKKPIESSMNNIKSMWSVINQKIEKNSKKKNNQLYNRKQQENIKF